MIHYKPSILRLPALFLLFSITITLIGLSEYVSRALPEANIGNLGLSTQKSASIPKRQDGADYYTMTTTTR